MGQSLFTMLDAEWSDFSRRPRSVERLRQWAKEDPVLRRFVDLESLVAFARTPGHPADSDDVLQCLARRSASDDVAARTLLQAVIYALVPITVRFRLAAGDGDEIAAVVVAAAYDRIRTYPVARRPRHIAANIILDTQQSVSRTLCRPRITEVSMADIDRIPIEVASPSPTDRVIALVDEAVRRRRLGRDDARIILLTRVFDVPVEELAIEHGCLPHSLRRRRLRAEAVLAAAVA
jgi:hypothetical protein